MSSCRQAHPLSNSSLQLHLQLQRVERERKKKEQLRIRHTGRMLAGRWAVTKLAAGLAFLVIFATHRCCAGKAGLSGQRSSEGGKVLRPYTRHPERISSSFHQILTRKHGSAGLLRLRGGAGASDDARKRGRASSVRDGLVSPVKHARTTKRVRTSATDTMATEKDGTISKQHDGSIGPS